MADFGLNFYVCLFGIIGSWALALQDYLKKFRKWNFVERRWRSPITAIIVLSAFQLLMIYYFWFSSEKLSLFNGLGLMIVFVYLGLLVLQVTMTRPNIEEEKEY